jgi:hypothetical protein
MRDDLVTARNPYEFLLLPSLQSDSVAARRAQCLSKYDKIRRLWRTFGAVGLVCGLVPFVAHGFSGRYAVVFSALPVLAEIGAILQVAIVRRRERVQQSARFSIASGTYES